MFTLLSIQQTAGGTTENPTGTAVRCIILADNTTDPLPESGADISGLSLYQSFLPGTVALTPVFNIAMVGNNGEWGAWS